VDASIFKSLHNVQLDTLPEFKFKGETFAFNEKYVRGIEIKKL